MNHLTLLPSPNQGMGKALVRHFLGGENQSVGGLRAQFQLWIWNFAVPLFISLQGFSS